MNYRRTNLILATSLALLFLVISFWKIILMVLLPLLIMAYLMTTIYHHQLAFRNLRKEGFTRYETTLITLLVIVLGVSLGKLTLGLFGPEYSALRSAGLVGLTIASLSLVTISLCPYVQYRRRTAIYKRHEHTLIQP